MAEPSLCTIVVGKASDFFGGATDIEVTVEPIIDGETTTITWAETGVNYVTLEARFAADVLSAPPTFKVPHVDQPGFINGNTDAVTYWAYRATVKARRGAKERIWTKVFQVVGGQSTLRLVDVPDGGITPGVTAPTASVSTVAGHSGVVTVAHLIDALSDGIEGVSEASVAVLRSALVGGAPELLNTLDELATAIGDDPQFAATLATQLGQKQVKAELSDDLAARLGNASDPFTGGLVVKIGAVVTGLVSAAGAFRDALDARIRGIVGWGSGVDPRDYGAVADGIADDTAAVQAAVAAAGPGGVLKIPMKKSFKLTGPVTVPSEFEVRGVSRKSSIIKTAGDFPAFITIGGEAQTFSRFKVQNSFAGTRTTYDLVVVNPFKTRIEHVEIALGQNSLIKGGIHVYKDVEQPGSANCFMPMFNDVWVRNGVIDVEDVTDGKFTDSFIWSTYTGATGSVKLTRASNWTFNDVDIVPPQGAGAAYLLAALNNLSISGGLIDGSYDTIMTGHGIVSTDFVRGLSVNGVKFFNLGRSGLKLYDVRRSSFMGNIFVQGNKADGSYPDIDLASCVGNVFIGNTHGAPIVRTNKGKVFIEDASCSDNLFSGNALEISSSIAPSGHYYDPALFTAQNSTAIKDNRPSGSWPASSVAVKSTNYDITKDDLFNGRAIWGTGTITLALPSAQTVHAGDQMPLKNIGTGIVTITTKSAQTIDGATTLTLQPGQAVTVRSDAANWEITASRALAPALLACPLATLTTISATVWPAANTAIFQRFSVEERRSYRYVNLRVDVASGNWQIAVVRLDGPGMTNYVRVMDTGVVAAPAAGDKHIDLGATKLSPGEYALVVWADNTTLQARVASNSMVSSSRYSAEAVGLASGVPSTGTVAWSSQRFLGGLTLEADV
jgi:hypothetical protein